MASVVRAGSRIEYEVTGDGPPLVLLHGIYGDRSTWHAAGHVGALADQFRLILIDLAGHFDTFTRTDLTVPLAREFLGRPRP